MQEKQEDDIKKINMRKGLLDLWQLFKPFKKQISLAIIFVALMEASNFIGPYILKVIIDKIAIFSSSQIPALSMLVIGYFLAQQGSSLIGFYRDCRIFSLLIKAEYELSLSAHKKMMGLSLGYHENENTGNKIIKVERGISKIDELVTSFFWEIIPVMLQLLLSLVFMLSINWRFALALIFFTPIFIIATFRVNEGLRPLRTKRYKDYEAASGKMGQAIININAVQSFVQEERESSEYQGMKDEIKKNEFLEWFKMLRYALGRSLIVDLGRVTTLILGIYLLAGQKIGIGSLVFAITMSERVYLSLYRLNRSYDKAAEGMIGVERFTGLMRESEEIDNKADGLKPKSIIGQIEFKNLSFVYKSTNLKALDNVSFLIPSGSFTALVGPSGGGKTTVARLIYRHYNPASGQVLLDGKDLYDYDLYAFRKLIAIVPQEVEVFDISVKDNIAYARPDASLEEIKAAARIANAEEFIDRLKEGYDTLVGERGIKLSGGQRQRLGIARAILANPKILIFDEATSSLDSQSERLIQEAIDRISHNRTLIVIAHRLSTIKKADKIIVLERGEVKEQGSHIELAHQHGGLYSELLKLQTIGEID